MGVLLIDILRMDLLGMHANLFHAWGMPSCPFLQVEQCTVSGYKFCVYQNELLEYFAQQI